MKNYRFDRELIQSTWISDLVEEIANHDCGIHGNPKDCLSAFRKAAQRLIERHNASRNQILDGRKLVQVLDEETK